jgi:hypothetical protein
MSNLRNTNMQLTDDLIDRLDKYVARLRRRSPGLRLRRSALIRHLLEQGCAADEAGESAPVSIGPKAA